MIPLEDMVCSRLHFMFMLTRALLGQEHSPHLTLQMLHFVSPAPESRLLVTLEVLSTPCSSACQLLALAPPEA